MISIGFEGSGLPNAHVDALKRVGNPPCEGGARILDEDFEECLAPSVHPDPYTDDARLREKEVLVASLHRSGMLEPAQARAPRLPLAAGAPSRASTTALAGRGVGEA